MFSKLLAVFVQASAVVLFASLIVSCADERSSAKLDAPAVPAVAEITGSVLYRERIALRPGSVVEVQVQDVSKADAPAEVLASVTMTPDGGPPFPFSISYDPAQIDARSRYALRASIHQGDRLLFTNDSYIDPFSGNPLEVMVLSVQPAPATEPPVLAGSAWELQTLMGETAAMGVNGKVVDIEFLAEDSTVAGFSGCNRYMGDYGNEAGTDARAADASPLSFGALAGTLMACPEGAELENSYRQMLQSVSAYKISENLLFLLAGDKIVAIFGVAKRRICGGAHKARDAAKLIQLVT